MDDSKSKNSISDLLGRFNKFINSTIKIEKIHVGHTTTYNFAVGSTIVLKIPLPSVLFVIVVVPVLIGLFIIVGILVGISSFKADLTAVVPAVETPSLAGCGYTKERTSDSEMIFLIGKFEQEQPLGDVQQLIDASISRAIEEHFPPPMEQEIPVYMCDFAIDQHKAAQLGALSRPSVVIWGYVNDHHSNVIYQQFERDDQIGAQVSDSKLRIIDNAAMARPITFTIQAIESESTFLPLYALSQYLFLTEDFTTTLDILDAAIRALDTSAPDRENGGLDEAYFQLGWSQVFVDSVDTGLATFNKGMKYTKDRNLDPNPNILYHRAYLHIFRADNIAFYPYLNRSEEYQRAENDLKDLLVLRPNNPYVYNQLGYIYYQRELYAEAQQLLSLAHGLELTQHILSPLYGEKKLADGTIAKNLGLLALAIHRQLITQGTSADPELWLDKADTFLNWALNQTLRRTARVQALIGIAEISTNNSSGTPDCASLYEAARIMPSYAKAEQSQLDTLLQACPTAEK